MATKTRVNNRIRAREVRTIDADGKQIGILSLNKALKLAEEKGLDLVEVAPQIVPPVCRIMDYGKFMYEQSKREKEAHKHQQGTKLKEIRLRPNTEPHDYDVKLNQAQDFLGKRYKVKLSMRFRGREMVHRDRGIQLLNRFMDDLKEYGAPEAQLKTIGKLILVTLGPVSKHVTKKNGVNPI